MPRVVVGAALTRWLESSKNVRGERAFDVAGQSVREAFDALFASEPQLRGYVVDELGAVRHHVVVFLDGVAVAETEPWRDGGEAWRVLRAYFPGSIETHCLVQDFFFGDDLLLRRHDYTVTIAGGLAAAQLTSEYVEAGGIRLPTKRRAYARTPDRRPILDLLLVSIDVSDVRFE